MRWAARRAQTRCGWRWPRRESGRGMSRGDHAVQFFRFGQLDSARRRDAGAGGYRSGYVQFSPAAVEAVLDGQRGADARAILPVHLYGQCLRIWTSFSGFGRERGLTLIEDAAQAWGAEWEGVKAGGLGDAAAFSFYPTKNLSAAGDAGMVTTNSDDVAERVKMLRQHGMRRRYYHDELGWNARMDGFPGRGAEREAEVHRRLE